MATRELRSDIWGGKTLETPRNIELVHQTISATQFFSKMGDLYQLIHKLNDFIALFQGRVCKYTR